MSFSMLTLDMVGGIWWNTAMKESAILLRQPLHKFESRLLEHGALKVYAGVVVREG